MEFKEVSLKELKPNPYRDLERYPLDPAKVDRLRLSVKETGFWNNVLARSKNGHYELAYGHHRIEAARYVLGPQAKVNVVVRDISDEHMLKIMAAENDDWQVGLPIRLKLEIVESAVKLMGTTIKRRTKGSHKWRGGHLAEQVAKFLGWKLSDTQRHVALLRGMEDGVISWKVLDEMPNDIDGILTLMRASKNARKQGKKFTESAQVSIAKEAQEKSMNKKQAVRILVSDYLHPIKKSPKSSIEELLKEAANRAVALDVILTELARNKEAIHSGTYKHSLEVFHVAASLHGVVKLAQEVFGKGQLKAAPKKELGE